MTKKQVEVTSLNESGKYLEIKNEDELSSIFRSNTKVSRNSHILKLWASGVSQTEMAEHLGITRSRLSQIIKRFATKDHIMKRKRAEAKILLRKMGG